MISTKTAKVLSRTTRRPWRCAHRAGAGVARRRRATLGVLLLASLGLPAGVGAVPNGPAERSLDEWLSCVVAAQDCAVHEAIATAFPRALSWLGILIAAMPPSPARDAAVATRLAIDGPDADGRPDPACQVAPAPDGCPESLLLRTPDVVLDDLRDAVAAQDWGAVACNYAEDAFVIDDQDILVGRQDIVAAAMSLADLFDGVSAQILAEDFFQDEARVLFRLDAGWIVIEDGVSSFEIQGGKIRKESRHGLISFTGPPPDQS